MLRLLMLFIIFVFALIPLLDNPSPKKTESIELISAPGESVIAAQQPQLPPSLTPTSGAIDAAPTLNQSEPDTGINPSGAYYRYTIEQQDTLGFIIQKYGYRYDPSDPGIIALIDEIVRINDNIFNPDFLPGVGSEILIPRQTATPAPTIANAAPTLAPPVIEEAPTSTPNPNAPRAHVVQPGDTLARIIQRYNYQFSQTLVDQIVALNPNIPNADSLPGPGTEILIPQKTPTPVPAGIELTLTVDASLGRQRFGVITLPTDVPIECHIVNKDETLVGIAEAYNTTLEVLSQLNQEYNWSGCNFTLYSGGPNCVPIIGEGDCVRVPLPPPTPTATSTPSGSETPTPTPTFQPPQGVFPPNGAIAPGGVFALQWVSVGILEQEDVYLIEIQDLTTNTVVNDVTRLNSYILPENLVPTDGQQHTIRWRVSVARQGVNNVYNYVGGIGEWRSFQWESR